VLIAAFKILVNELAIDYASSSPVPGRPQVTWAGRRRDDYGDYPSDPVEYASREFAERLNGKLKMLLSDTVFSNLPSPNLEWDKLCYLGSLIGALNDTHPLRIAYNNLTAGLLFAFRQWIDAAIDLDGFSPRVKDLVEAQRSHYIPSYERTPLINLYRNLNPAQKVLTPFFWTRLSITETRADFAATPIPNTGNTLAGLEQTFNAALRPALTDNTITPSPLHPSCSHLAPPLATNREVEFNLAEFHRLLVSAVTRLAAEVLHNNHNAFVQDAESAIPFFLSDHLLLCLSESELNYLPIWADGLDDGSGGVFQQFIPEAEMGPSEPGPGYHTGFTAAGTTEGAFTETELTTDGGDGKSGYAPSTIAPPASDLGVGKLSLGTGAMTMTGTSAGTVGRSLAVQQSGVGTSVSGGSGVTPGSEAFTVDTAEEEGMYADARYAQPAAHQAQGEAIERYVDEAEAEGEGGGSGMDFDLSDDDEMDFGSDDDGSSTLDGFEEVDVDEAH
jgi:hypothetical protein